MKQGKADAAVKRVIANGELDKIAGKRKEKTTLLNVVNFSFPPFECLAAGAKGSLAKPITDATIASIEKNGGNEEGLSANIHAAYNLGLKFLLIKTMNVMSKWLADIDRGPYQDVTSKELSDRLYDLQDAAPEDALKGYVNPLELLKREHSLDLRKGILFMRQILSAEVLAQNGVGKTLNEGKLQLFLKAYEAVFREGTAASGARDIWDDQDPFNLADGIERFGTARATFKPEELEKKWKNATKRIEQQGASKVPRK